MAKQFVGQEYQVATQGKGLEQTSRGVRIATRVTVAASVSLMVCSTLVVLLCLLFYLSPINGTSMMVAINATGLNTDQAVVCRVQTPQRGDIFITKLYLEDTNQCYYDANGNILLTDYVKEHYSLSDSKGRYNNIIKRLIAVGGDRITMTRTPNENNNLNPERNYDYTIYINGEPLIEDYLDPKIGSRSSTTMTYLWRALNNQNPDLSSWKCTNYKEVVSVIDGVPTLTVPEGFIFFMGDNRNGFELRDPATGTIVIDPTTNKPVPTTPSLDCTLLGPQPADYIVGVAWDIVPRDTDMFTYVLNKIWYFISFAWAWR